MQLLQKSGIQMNARETIIEGILSHPDKNYDFYIVKRKVSMFIGISTRNFFAYAIYEYNSCKKVFNRFNIQ